MKRGMSNQQEKDIERRLRTLGESRPSYYQSWMHAEIIAVILAVGLSVVLAVIWVIRARGRTNTARIDDKT